ncbi:hypothetical protein KIH77_05715 [Bifidobacterium sp. 82T24]|uniref:hypothetical protein n=1 Tax=Bifidobacterium pluvialisilvae TaxID=2834436 RepID=UPI001C55D9A8|nr:hypothetical protein [Bifidobacterium pluvialisilvae]MBW3088227.1 hypothetical protein [Bifidobacterium pluvialisilvae]
MMAKRGSSGRKTPVLESMSRKVTARRGDGLAGRSARLYLGWRSWHGNDRVAIMAAASVALGALTILIGLWMLLRRRWPERAMTIAADGKQTEQ